MDKAKLVSVIIVNWNGEKWLEACLSSLKRQTYKNFEVIIVDNNSSDKSTTFIRKNFPEYKLITNKHNEGFAKGNNIGIKASKGEYLILLNNDTSVESNYIKNFIKAFQDIPNLGIAQSKIIWSRHNDLIDGCGSFWTYSTFLYHYGFRKSASLKEYNHSFPIFSAKGASMILKRDVIDKVGMFDEDFWCYYEETDLCHRAWLAGFECWYYPFAKIDHFAGGSSIHFKDSYVQFHNFKNKWLSFIKNFQISSLIPVLFLYFLSNIFLSIYYIVTGKVPSFMAINKAIIWNLQNLGATLKKRHQIQKIRKVTDLALNKTITKNPKLSYFTYLLKDQVTYYKDSYI